MKASFNPWPYAIIVTFAVFIAATVGLVVFVSSQHMDLVSPDYYEQEIRFQGHMDRMEHTQALRQAVQMRYSETDHAIRVNLPPAPAGQRPAGRIHLYRPSAAGQDRQLDLALDDAGAQQIDARPLAPGFWRVRVNWTVAGTDYFAEEGLVVPPRKS